MGNDGDAWLARHAIPGVLCDCAATGAGNPAPTLTTDPIRISPDDSAEVAKMKSLVNGMKRELAEYLSADGTAAALAACRYIDMMQL